MLSGATYLGENRFALLSSSPQSKRKKSNKPQESFPDLPQVNITKCDDPKYIVIKAVDKEKPLAKYSCFSVHKAILAISKEINSIAELRDGSLLVLTKNKRIAEKFLNAKNLPGICHIECSYHVNLNCVKGTIFAPFLKDMTESEIVEGLKPHGVISVYKFQRKINDTVCATGALLLTFDSYFLPEKIDVAWWKLSVRPYFPNPMRCRSCQIIGHTMKHCKNFPTCINCNLPPHMNTECTRTMCANCSGDHPSNAFSCPKFLQAKEILKIKVIDKCSIREATKKYKARTLQNSLPQTYSQIISSPSIAQSKTVNKSNIDSSSNISTTSSKNITETTSQISSINKNNNKEINLVNAQQISHSISLTPKSNSNFTPIISYSHLNSLTSSHNNSMLFSPSSSSPSNSDELLSPSLTKVIPDDIYSTSNDSKRI